MPEITIGTLVRVRDYNGVDASWRGQLCVVVDRLDRTERGNARIWVKRLHDGEVGSVMNPNWREVFELPNEEQTDA